MKKLNQTKNSILAISLGLMHEKCKRNNTSSYFSLSIPSTISMPPNFLRNYVKKII